jgi:hypothetical protein
MEKSVYKILGTKVRSIVLPVETARIAYGRTHRTHLCAEDFVDALFWINWTVEIYCFDDPFTRREVVPCRADKENSTVKFEAERVSGSTRCALADTDDSVCSGPPGSLPPGA